jgi:hypothetical protein
MCTYLTEHIAVTGSGKGREGWFRLTDATVYYDHPVHALDEHTLNIDFAAPALGPAARVAVELDADSALRLIEAVRRALASRPDAVVSREGSRLPDAAIRMGDRQGGRGGHSSAMDGEDNAAGVHPGVADGEHTSLAGH